MPGSRPPEHPITSTASVRRMYALLLSRPGFRRAYSRLLKAIYRAYLRPQYFQASGHAKIPLDMELDAALPFDPTWLPCYLGFVRLWEGCLGWLHLRFGDRALPEMEGFLAGMESLFLAARKVFAEADSTMATRPGWWPPGPFRTGPWRLERPARLDWLMIQLLDRNSFCFPSLHVMIARYTALRTEAALDRLQGPGGQGPGGQGPGEGFQAERAFLAARSARIVESIAYVKQHSLNDIPAGLFLLRNTEVTGGCPPRSEEADRRFLRGLFPGEDAKLGGFMIALYERLQSARAADPDWPERALLAFLKDYRGEVARLLQGL